MFPQRTRGVVEELANVSLAGSEGLSFDAVGEFGFFRVSRESKQRCEKSNGEYFFDDSAGWMFCFEMQYGWHRVFYRGGVGENNRP